MTRPETPQDWDAEVRAYAGPRTAKAILRQVVAEPDDHVVLHGVGDEADPAQLAIVALKGHEVIACFREWAIRNKILTPGKPPTPAAGADLLILTGEVLKGWQGVVGVVTERGEVVSLEDLHEIPDALRMARGSVSVTFSLDPFEDDAR